MSSMLDQARENHDHRLRATLEAMRGDFNPAGYVMVSICYRALACCAALLEADTDSFFLYLGNAANARLDFLEKAKGREIPPRYLALSKDLGFTCAVAAEDWPVAEAISALSNTEHTDTVEYEDDFLFFRVLHLLLTNPDDVAGIERHLTRWAEVLEGEESGFLQVCTAMCGRDQDGYADAYEALHDARESQLDAYSAEVSADAELLAIERGVFIDALAVARLAERLGLRTPGVYAMAPDLVLRQHAAGAVDRSAWANYP